MGRKVEFDVFANSQYAIRDYMHFKDGNDYIHDAKVIVSSQGKSKYNNILQVIPRIETNNSFVDIVSDTQFERDYYGKYTNEYQQFTFCNGTLLINGEDRWGNPIEINISRV